jgi:hypothetical protein
MKPGAPCFTSTRRLDPLRERIRYLHYSLQTERAHLYWVRFFIRWHDRGVFVGARFQWPLVAYRYG